MTEEHLQDFDKTICLKFRHNRIFPDVSRLKSLFLIFFFLLLLLCPIRIDKSSSTSVILNLATIKHRSWSTKTDLYLHQFLCAVFQTSQGRAPTPSHDNVPPIKFSSHISRGPLPRRGGPGSGMRGGGSCMKTRTIATRTSIPAYSRARPPQKKKMKKKSSPPKPHLEVQKCFGQTPISRQGYSVNVISCKPELMAFVEKLNP